MSIPQRVNIHDGNHRMVLAKVGERILTPSENKEYERTHPDARKRPMQAEVYDGGGDVKKPTHLADAYLADAAAPVQDSPLMNQEAFDCGGMVYDKGGDVPAPAQDDSLWGKIKNRAAEIYSQEKSAVSRYIPTVQEPMGGIAANQQNIDQYKAAEQPQKMQQPYSAAPSDRVNPKAKYGDRPGEKRPEQMAPLYDDGGTVQPEKNDQEKAADDAAAKDAAMRQATQEVHMEEAPISHGTMGDREDARALRPPVRMQYDTENPVDESKGVADNSSMSEAHMSIRNAPLEKPQMNMKNTPALQPEIMEREASTINTPRPERMNYTPQSEGLAAGPVKEDIDQAAAQGDVASADYATPKAPSPEKQIVLKDQMDAMKSGDLVKLGMSNINLRMLEGRDKEHPESVQPALPTPTAPTARENIVNQKAELKNKMINAPTEQERFQAEKDLAELNRRTPWGSEGNHPGMLGKIGHVMSRVGQAALMPTAPYLAPAIPGSQANIAAQEARGEQGVEQAQKKQQQAAVTKEAEQQPALREEAQKLTAQKMENTLRTAGFKTDPATGEHVPLTYEEMSPVQQAAYDQKESIQTLNEAKGHEQEAKAILEKYKADPNNAQNKIAMAKLQEEAKRTSIAAGKLGLDKTRFLADYYGLGADGQPIPGAQLTPEGKPIGPKMTPKGTAGQPTANQKMKADLADNVIHNVDEATKLIRNNPDLFGKVSGRFTSVAQMMGSNDKAIAKLGLILHNTALATNGIHGLRSAQAIEGTEKALLNKFKNSPEATIAALKENRRSVGDFMKDGGKAPIVDPDLVPHGASDEVLDKAGNVIGHIVNKKYVALPKE